MRMRFPLLVLVTDSLYRSVWDYFSHIPVDTVGPSSQNEHLGIALANFYAVYQNASRVLAMAWASVCPSVRYTLDLYQNGAS